MFCTPAMKSRDGGGRFQERSTTLATLWMRDHEVVFRMKRKFEHVAHCIVATILFVVESNGVFGFSDARPCVLGKRTLRWHIKCIQSSTSEGIQHHKPWLLNKQKHSPSVGFQSNRKSSTADLISVSHYEGSGNELAHGYLKEGIRRCAE